MVLPNLFSNGGEKEIFGWYYCGYYFWGMALVPTPTKLSETVLEKIADDIKGKIFPNKNKAINEILKNHYGIISEFQFKKSKVKPKN